MSQPVRIQRKRTKGWRLPPNTVCVTRPSKWGNPFYLVEYPGRWHSWNVFSRIDLDAEENPELVGRGDTREEAAAKAVALFDAALAEGDLGYWSSDVQNELRGKNLACFCPVGSPCHADVLLRVANKGSPCAQ